MVYVHSSVSEGHATSCLFQFLCSSKELPRSVQSSWKIHRAQLEHVHMMNFRLVGTQKQWEPGMREIPRIEKDGNNKIKKQQFEQWSMLEQKHMEGEILVALGANTFCYSWSFLFFCLSVFHRTKCSRQLFSHLLFSFSLLICVSIFSPLIWALARILSLSVLS